MFLYVKTHKITGLKYLGKTEQKDPYAYKGSGLVWKRHLKKHGSFYDTEILLETDDKDELRAAGTYYSNLWNVVESSEWANLVAETGDGGDTSASERFRIGMLRRDFSKENNPMFGRSAIKEKNLKWYNNGTENIYVTEGCAPEGFVRGRVGIKRKSPSKETRERISRGNMGRIAPNSQKIISPSGEVFDSIKKAASFLGLTTSQFRHRYIRTGQWSFVNPLK